MSDQHRKAQLESRLRTILTDLSVVCAELGIDLGAATPPPPAAPTAMQGPAPPSEVEGQEVGEALKPGQVLLAEVGGLQVGFVARQVQEITRMVALTHPSDPRPELEGYVNVRGQAVSVVGLRHLLGLPAVTFDPDQFLVFLRARRGRIAVVVDEVADIFEVSAAQIQDRGVLELQRGFVQGVAQIEGKLVTVIDPRRLAAQAL